MRIQASQRCCVIEAISLKAKLLKENSKKSTQCLVYPPIPFWDSSESTQEISRVTDVIDTSPFYPFQKQLVKSQPFPSKAIP